jgi:hypothetical protein
MTEAVFQFKAINRKLNRQDQKAEFEANNPKEEPQIGWPYGVAVPYALGYLVELPDGRLITQYKKI